MVTDRTAQGFLVHLPLLGFCQIFLSCGLTVGPGLDPDPVPYLVKKHVDDLLCFLPCFVEQPHIVRVGDVLVGNGGVQLKLPFVLARPIRLFGPVATADHQQ